MLQTTINLLRPTEKESVQVITVKEEARRIAFIVFVCCVSLGILVLVVSFILNTSLQNSQTTNKSLKKQVQEYKQIESLISVVKTRTSVIEKALQYSKPVDSQIAYINAIASPPVLQGLTYDEAEKISVTFRPSSIGEAMTMAGAFIKYSDEKHIRNPRIESYGFDGEGMRIVFTYIPVWEQL
jgi:hypothetical protein